MKPLYRKWAIVILSVFLLGAGSMFTARHYFPGAFHPATADDLSLDDQEATIRAIERNMPAVVSINIFGQVDTLAVDLSTGKQSTVKEKEQIGSGTGFLISADGLILTNKHVATAADTKDAEYQITLSSGKKYYAQFIGTDPLRDLAILKIFDKDLPYVELGDSGQLKVGETVIAIGNILGRYQNSATKGIISGLGRFIMSTDNAQGDEESLDNVIQTDAEINLGNSGGPLIDLHGRVVGVNVAIDQAGRSVGFAIPINDARPVVNSVIASGRIIRPWLGVYYQTLSPEIAEQNGLTRSAGAWLSAPADNAETIAPGSPAEKAGLQQGDIVFEINAIKLDERNTLFDIIQRYKPGDKVGLKVQRGDKILILTVVLEEYK